MAKKKKAEILEENPVWFEIRLEKPLRIELDGEVFDLLPGKKKTITNHTDLVREAQRLGAEIQVFSKQLPDLVSLARQGFKIVSKTVEKIARVTNKGDEPPITEEAQPEPQEPETEAEPNIETEVETKSVEHPPETKTLDLLKVDLSELSEEEKAKLRELLGE
jgi:hypothetical protein